VTGMRSHDAARRVVGHKRHALLNTDYRLLMVAVSPASLHDRRGGAAVLAASRQP